MHMYMCIWMFNSHFNYIVYTCTCTCTVHVLYNIHVHVHVNYQYLCTKNKYPYLRGLPLPLLHPLPLPPRGGLGRGYNVGGSSIPLSLNLREISSLSCKIVFISYMYTMYKDVNE